MFSSCFDCIHLRDGNIRNYVYRCPIFHKTMSYDEARTPNRCAKKQQNLPDVISFTVSPILENLYKSCVELAYYIERPFTVRELSEHLNYSSKNSLWMLLEQLVQQGRMEKSDATTTNYRGQRYQAKVYFPRSEYIDTSRGILSQ